MEATIAEEEVMNVAGGGIPRGTGAPHLRVLTVEVLGMGRVARVEDVMEGSIMSGVVGVGGTLEGALATPHLQCPPEVNWVNGPVARVMDCSTSRVCRNDASDMAGW